MDDKLFPQPPGEASFVAIGDSFTEGLNDAAPGGGFRGWADRLAGLLAAQYPGLRYANLAVRGRLLRQIVAEQVPAAAKLEPGLVSITRWRPEPSNPNFLGVYRWNILREH